jgi:capsular exopolysaccharide synthesis family protein
VITAHARNAVDAAAIANAFAQSDATLSTSEIRSQYRSQARQLQLKIRQLGGGPTTQAIYQSQLSRLQSLSTVATPVEVSSTAQTPSTPTSPKPVRNTVVALLFGLLLGIGLAYARETFDRRLQRTSDVESVLPLPVVGHIGPDALGQAGAYGLGANGNGRFTDADAESFRILRENVRHLADAELKTLLVTSALAEEGKSTVAACLAIANAAAGNRTLLVDCDLRRPVVATRFGLPDGPGLTDYLLGNATPQEIIRPVDARLHPREGQAVQQGSSALVCITAGSQAARPAELLGSDRFHAFLEQVADVYDCVIIDSPPLLTVADALEIVPRVSGVLLCVRLEQTTRDQATAARTALGRLPERPTAVVVTNVTGDGEGYYYGYYEPTARVTSAAG